MSVRLENTKGLPGLVARRKALGWTQEELATRVGLHRVTVANYEIGLQDPGLKKVRDLASALGCTPADLLTPPNLENSDSGAVVDQKSESEVG